MKNYNARIFLFILLCGLQCMSVALQAQTTTGSIYGDVLDPANAAIPNASVTVTNTQTNESHELHTNGVGAYIFASLVPGNYTVTSKAAGFSAEKQINIQLDSNQNVHVGFVLHLGAATETITVVAATTLVDTRESQLGSTIDEKRLQELPLNGRDAYDLVSLSPGVVNYTEGKNGTYAGETADPVGATFSTNGLRLYQNSFYLDGALDLSLYRPGGNIPPNPDALQELRVLTSNFDAEFGEMPGAVVNMVTRSGTNNFHGMLYDYVRNTIFNTRSWNTTGPATHLRWNQFGGNLGGPIIKDKLFAFFSYQGFRVATQNVALTGNAILPTGPNGTGAGQTYGASPLGERNGDFSTDAVKPTCGAKTFPCGGPAGVIPAAYS